jgi:hypothetical protein
VPGLVFDVTALDRASQAFNRIADRIDFLIARLAALNASSANVRLDVDTDPADRTLGRWAINFRRQVREALAEIPTIDIGINSTQARAELGQLRGELGLLLNRRIGIDIEAAEAIAEIERIKAELAAIDQSDADIQVKADIAAALAALEAVLAKAREVEQSDPEVKVDVDQRGLRDIINGIALFQRSVAQLGQPVAIIGLTPAVLSLADSLTDLLGLLGLVPALIFGVVAAAAALATAFQGVGTAISETDPEKFAAAMAEITPNAQQAVIAIRAFGTAWQGVIDVVQEATFEGVAESFQQLAGLIPTLQGGLQGLGAALGDTFNQWTDFATGIEANQELGQIFENIRAAVVQLAPGIVAVAEALTDMALAGAQLLPDLAVGFTNVAQEFAGFIDEVTANGAFQEWILNAVDTADQLFTIIGDLVTGFGGLFDAVNNDGVTALDTIEGIAEAFTEFTNSVEGQNTLAIFFQSIKDIVNELGPAIGDFLVVLGAGLVAAAPGLTTLAAAIGDLIEALGPAVPMAAAVIGALAPIATVIATIVTALGPVAPVILATWLAFAAGNAILAGVGAVITFLGVQANTATLAMARMAGAAGFAGAATAISGLAAGMRVAFAGLVTFLTGPFGIAILGAIAVLALLSGGQDSAGAAAQEHENKVQGLIGTLNQMTGAVTEATQQQIALDLAQETLADGTTSLATAVQQVGVSWSDYVAASSGNEAALERVNAQLVAQATAFIENEANLSRWSGSLEAAGVPAEVLALAVIGNVEALNSLTGEYGLNAATVEIMIAALREQIGVLDEVGMALGGNVGALNEAQLAAQIAADSTADFNARLLESTGAMQQYGAIVDDVTGAFDPLAAGATALSESLEQLGVDALATARNMGRIAAANGDVAAGGAAAAASMAESRAAFVAAAEAAGIGTAAANALADSIGLIPAVAEIAFETNADQTTIDIANVVAAIMATPDAKAIRVDALTDEAIAALQAAGVVVNELPNGQIELLLQDSEFYAQLQAAIAAGATLPEILVMLGLDVGPANAELDAWLAQNPQLAVPISLETEGAQGEFDGFVAEVEGTMMEPPLLLDTGPAEAELGGFMAIANTSTPTPILQLDEAPATGELLAFLALADASIGTPTITADPAPANAILAATLAAINAALGTLTIAAANGPAMATLAATVAAVNAAAGTMTIRGDAGPAIAAARAAVATINGMSASFTITRREITVVSRTAADASGGLVTGGMMRFAKGGIVPGYAPGIDRVPALLSPGEGILVPEAVRLLGARAVANINKLASGGRKMGMLSKTGNDAYMSFGTPGGRSGSTGGGYGAGNVYNYHLTVVNASNNEVNLRDQFRRMETLGV